MPTNISRITINASLQKVWDALTNPVQVKRWQFGSDLKTTWEPGSPIVFETAWEEKIFKQWGTVLEVKQNELVKYNLFAPRPDLEDKPENYFIMSYIISESGNKIKLEIQKEDNRPGAVAEKESTEENPVLTALKEISLSNCVINQVEIIIILTLY